MFKYRKYLLFIGLLIFSCSTDAGDDPVIPKEEPQDIIPSNLSVTEDVVGLDSNHLYGNGTGVVNFTASATNATSYGFIIDGKSEQKSLDGSYQHTFNTNEGVENHEIKITAYSSTSNSINTIKNVSVAFYNGTPPIWADEFFEDGAPNFNNWIYNLGAGGWGNNELQTYTSKPENVIVEGGVLKIIAKSDGSGGYTSARIKSENLQEFTYRTVKVRAKLPAKQGTWPAIWMLGANFDLDGWPKCGEIDIMEQLGSDKGKVLGTCHWLNTSTNSYASYGLEKSVTNATTQFHVYAMEWDASTIKILVDNVQYYIIDISNSGMPNSPFHKDFFLILNLAMGGNLGGTIDPGFTQDTMEIDYVRVYQ